MLKGVDLHVTNEEVRPARHRILADVPRRLLGRVPTQARACCAARSNTAPLRCRVSVCAAPGEVFFAWVSPSASKSERNHRVNTVRPHRLRPGPLSATYRTMCASSVTGSLAIPGGLRS